MPEYIDQVSHAVDGIVSVITDNEGSKSVSSVTFFQVIQNQNHLNPYVLLNIMYMFNRCCYSLAAMTPVKYENDSSNLTGNLQSLSYVFWVHEPLHNASHA